jgi:hypothetical protein
VRSRDQRRRGLVEADVSVESEPEDLQIDPSGSVNRSFVARALAPDIRRIAARRIDACLRQIDAIEQVLTHECAIARRMCRANADELVKIECACAPKVGAAFAV